jgi:hypothetical protein
VVPLTAQLGGFDPLHSAPLGPFPVIGVTAMGGVKKAVVTPVSNNIPPLPDLPFTVIVPRACCQSVSTLADAGAVCHWVESGANSGSSLIMAKPRVLIDVKPI